MKGGEFGEVTTTWAAKDSDTRCVLSGMLGRVSLADFRRWLDEHAPGVADEDLMINYSTVRWDRPATGEELADRAARRKLSAERLEEWERETLRRLTEKYEEMK